MRKKLISLFLIPIVLGLSHAIPTKAASILTEREESNLTENLMSIYRSNSVKFIIENHAKFKIKQGNFTIESSSITPGQDKNGYYSNNIADDLRTQDFYSSSDHNQIYFNVGRKESKTVANWLNDRTFNGLSTSFGHPAKKLNFAFMGKLTLNLDINDTGYLYPLIFPNVILAQGHSGSTNNWWIGQAYSPSVGNSGKIYMCSSEFNYMGKLYKALVKFIRGGVGSSYDEVKIEVVDIAPVYTIEQKFKQIQKDLL